MPNDKDSIRLQHMLDAARKATHYIEGRSRSDLDKDEMLTLALIRLLEIIGEAARNVTVDEQLGFSLDTTRE